MFLLKNFTLFYFCTGTEKSLSQWADLKYYLPKILLLSSLKYGLGNLRKRIPGFKKVPDPDPGVKKAPDP